MAIADDGIRVWVDDDQLVINQWQGQAATPVQVEYFDTAAEVMANVLWAVKT